MIYFMRHTKTGYIKIGYSGGLRQRLRTIVSTHGVLEPIGLMEGGRDTERQLHAAFKDDRAPMRGEVEWYHPNADLVFYIACNTDVPISLIVDDAARRPIRPVKNSHKICRPFLLRIIKAEKEGRLPTAEQDMARIMGISYLVFKRLRRAKFHLLTNEDIQPVADFFGCSVDELLHQEIE